MKEKNRSVPKPLFPEDAKISKSSVSKKAEQISKPIQSAVASHDVDCLVVSCAELVALIEKDFGFKVEESFLEEAAINSVKKSVNREKQGLGRAFKFVFIDLDDPTLIIGRFMESLNALFADNPTCKIEVFACASSSSDRILKKCEELKVKFVPKPIYEHKLRQTLKAFV